MPRLLQFLILVLSIVPASLLTGQKTALLLIDIQDFYFPGGKVVLENPELAGMNAGLILEQFRNRGMPVYHVRHNFEPGGDIHEYVRPLPGEKVFSKDQVNAFLGTDLLSDLRADSITAIVFCGMQTHMCVEAAVRAAHDEGFACILVGDACTTRALQYEEYIISAKYVHYATLQTLQDTYAKVITSGQLLKEFDQVVGH